MLEEEASGDEDPEGEEEGATQIQPTQNVVEEEEDDNQEDGEEDLPMNT